MNIFLDKEDPVDFLLNRYGVTAEELQAKIKPLFLLMNDHGIENLSIKRIGKKVSITFGETSRNKNTRTSRR